MECNICGAGMRLWDNQKWICTNPSCTNVILKNSRPWYLELGEDGALWSEKFIKSVPAVLAYEYQALRDMLINGEVSGLALKVKDIFEVALKFPMLLVLSDAFNRDSRKNFYNDILYGLICKLPSLGDWYKAAHALTDANKVEDIFIGKILRDIDEIYRKNEIVHWRNAVIGHGAFNSTENEEFRADLVSKIKIIVGHFNGFVEEYSKIRILLKYKKVFIPLVGLEKADKLKHSNDDLYFEVDGKNKRSLIPLIRNFGGGIFFFDSYISRKSRTAYLNYVSGQKNVSFDEIINRLYKKLLTSFRIALTETSAESEIRGRRSEDSVEELLKPSQLVPLDFLRDKFREIISANERGIYLLEMKNGMGKTTFVKMLDGAAYRKSKIKSTMCRAFYINSVYSHSKLAFIQGLTDSMRRLENGDQLVGDIPTVDVNSPDAKTQVADLLNKLFDANRKISDVQALLFVIDGIDELPNTEGSTIADLIPDNAQLSKGVHLMVTCRTEAQTSAYTKSILEKISFDEVVCVDENNSDYRAVLKKIVADKTGAPSETVEKIVALADNRMLNIENLTRAYLQVGEKILENAPNNLFEVLRELYGEKYYGELINFATRLAVMPVPITIYDLANLSAEEFVSFKLIAYLGEFKTILDIRHNSDGSFITITRPEIRDKLKSSDKVLAGIYSSWKDDLQESVKSKNLDKKLFLLEYLGLCAAPEKYRDAFVKEKNFIDCSKVIALNIHAKSDWDYDVINKLLGILCRDIAPLFAENRYDKNIEALVFVAQRLAEAINMHGGKVAEAIENLENLFNIIQAKEFDSPTQYDFCTLIGTMLSKIHRNEESKKYFALAEYILNSAKKIFTADENNTDGVANTVSLIRNAFEQAVVDKNNMEYDRAIKKLTYAEKLIDRLEKSGYGAEIASHKVAVLKTFGNVYKRQDPRKALKYFLEAMKILDAIKTEDPTAKNARVDLLMNTGQTYRVLGEHGKAAKLYDEGIALAKSMQIKGEVIEGELLASLYHSRGNIERDLNNHQKSIEFYSEALKIAETEMNAGRFIKPMLVASIRVTLDAARKKAGQFNF